MSGRETQVLCPHCGSSVNINNLEFHFGLHEEKG